MKRLAISLCCLAAAMTFAACTPVDDRPAGNSGPAASTTPLPDSVYKAQITIVNAPPTLKAGEQVSLKIKVKNLGNGNWPAQGQGSKYKVDLGNHWLDKKGTEVTADDGRTGLPHDLKPGEEAELSLTVKAPKTSGEYILVLDMVHEDVTWFGPRGSQTVKTNITVQ